MFVVRPKQLEALGESARRNFEDEMVAHGRLFAPRLSEVIGDDQLRLAVRAAIARAQTCGFTNRGPIRLFVELMFLCGSSFDTDPQYAVLGGVLHSKGDQMERARQIHEGHNDYLARVSGPGNANVHAALRQVLAFARSPLLFGEANLASSIAGEMKRVFPQKAEYVGNAALQALVDEAADEASRHRFAGDRPRVLLAVLRFAFGHGCTNDPLYPWIGQTLEDPKIVSPEARAARLEKKAITWLEHVVARNEKGSERP